MARFIGNLQLIRSTFMLALLTSAFAIPTYSQSTSPNSTPAELKPEVTESNQESKQPLPVDSGAEPSPPASPEELRQAQIEADTKKLYLLAAELRAEVAKTYKDSLSLNVIKKAEDVEKLAKSLKALMSKETTASKH